MAAGRGGRRGRREGPRPADRSPPPARGRLGAGTGRGPGPEAAADLAQRGPPSRRGRGQPAAAALLAAVARAYVPWYGTPNPPPAAAAPRYPVPSGSAAPEGAAAHGAATRDAADRPEAPPTDAGEALLPGLTDVFTALAAPAPARDRGHPAAVPWRTRYAGRFRHYGRPARHVWTADTFRCPGCSNADGPWIVVCDWRRVTLGCPCGGDDRPPRPHVLRGLPRPARRVRRPRSAALPGRAWPYAHVRRAGPRPP